MSPQNLPPTLTPASLDDDTTEHSTEGLDDTSEHAPPSQEPSNGVIQQVGRACARYQDNTELGRGGIGRVLRSFDSALRREVAIKELLSEAAQNASNASGRRTGQEDRMRQRFLREARITGSLEHPNIVPVHELGERPDGTLYYSMKMVRGRTLRAALDDARTQDARLALLKHLLDLCHAIAYAHSHNVIHRDIKPDNVMLGEFGETIVLDWGLARVLGDTKDQPINIHEHLKGLRQSANLKTVQGLPLGTPAYMSPEQALGELHRVDQRSDVWSLGVVLYELLSGQTPVHDGTPLETVMKIAAEPPPPVRDVAPDAPPELASICMKALSQDPKDRFADARALASELDAFLSGRRVASYQYKSWELVQRLINKNRPLALASVLFFLAVLLGLVLLSIAYRQTSNARAEAEDANAQSQAALLAEAAAREAAERERGAAQIAQDQAQTANAKAQDALRAQAAARTETFDALSQSYAERAEYLLSQHNFQAARLAAAQAIYNSPYHPKGPNQDPKFLASPDAQSRRIALASLYLSAQSRARHTQTLDLKGQPRRLAFSPDNKYLAATTDAGLVHLWDISQNPPKPLDLPATPSAVAEADPSALAFSPDSRLLAMTGPLGRSLLVFDLPAGKLLYTLDVDAAFIRDLAFSPHHPYLAAVGAGLYVWNTSDGSLLTASTFDAALSHAISLHWANRALAVFTGHLNGWVFFHSLSPVGSAPYFQQPKLSPVIGLHGPANETLFNVISQDGQILSLGAHPQRAGELAVISNNFNNLVFTERAEHTALSRDERWTFVAGGRSTHIWDTFSHEHIEQIRFPAASADIALSPSQSVLALAGPGPHVFLWSWNERLPYSFLARAHYQVLRLEPHPSQGALYGYDATGNAMLWSTDKIPASNPALTLTTYDYLHLPERALRLALDPGVGVPALYAEPSPAEPMPSAAPLLRLRDANPSALLLNGLPVSQNQRAAYLTDRGTCALLDLSSLKRLSSIPAADATAVAVSPDGQWLLVGTQNARISLWSLSDPERPTLAWSLTAHESELLRLSFSPDSRSILSTSKDGTWQTRLCASGALQHKGHHNGRWLTDAAFSPDGRLILSSGLDHAARLWDAFTGDLIHIYPASEPLLAVAFSPDGQTVFFSTGERVFQAPLPPPNLWTNDPKALLEDALSAIPPHAIEGFVEHTAAGGAPPSGPARVDASSPLSGRVIVPFNRQANAPPSRDSVTYLADAPPPTAGCTIQHGDSAPVLLSKEGLFSLQDLPAKGASVLVRCPEGDTLSIAPWQMKGLSDVEITWLNISALRRVLRYAGFSLPAEHVIISGRFIDQRYAAYPSQTSPVGCVEVHAAFTTAFLTADGTPDAKQPFSHPSRGAFWMIAPPNKPIQFNAIAGDTLLPVSIPAQPPGRVVSIEIPVPEIPCKTP